MNRAELLIFLRRHSLAVQASVSLAMRPQAAVVGFVATDELELFFDTLSSSRKMHNLRGNPRLAFVVGWDEEQTVQYEGLADEPEGAELARLQQLYFARFPDGRERQSWPGVAYVRVKPTWIRYSDFRGVSPEITHFEGERLKR